MREVWKTTPANAYEVSSFGRIRRSKPGKSTYVGKILNPHIRNDGYLQVNINRRLTLVHLLVCVAFNGPKPTPKHQCNHKDGNKQNNKCSNLEWVTSSQNNYHRYRVLNCRKKGWQNRVSV